LLSDDLSLATAVIDLLLLSVVQSLATAVDCWCRSISLLSIDLPLATTAAVAVDRPLSCCRSIYILLLCCYCCCCRSISLLSINLSLATAAAAAAVDAINLVAAAVAAIDRSLCCQSISLLSIDLSLATAAAVDAIDLLLLLLL
jgi:hypothetical protein